MNEPSQSCTKDKAPKPPQASLPKTRAVLASHRPGHSSWSRHQRVADRIKRSRNRQPVKQRRPPLWSGAAPGRGERNQDRRNAAELAFEDLQRQQLVAQNPLLLQQTRFARKAGPQDSQQSQQQSVRPVSAAPTSERRTPFKRERKRRALRVAVRFERRSDLPQNSAISANRASA